MEVNQIDIEEIVKKILNDLKNEPKENIKENNSTLPSTCRAAVLTEVKK
jgi:hypothetical protein